MTIMGFVNFYCSFAFAKLLPDHLRDLSSQICDLVLVSAPEFGDGLGLTIHIR